MERSYEKRREEREREGRAYGRRVGSISSSLSAFSLSEFSRVHVTTLREERGGTERFGRRSGPLFSLSLSLPPSLYLGEDDRRVKEKRRRGARERVGCRWWGKKQKSSRSWSGPGWSQAIRDHPESRGVQLGSRQSGAVGMRPSGEKNKTNFYALVLPSPFLSAFSFAFAPLSLSLSLPSSSLALPLVVSRPPREKH